MPKYNASVRTDLRRVLGNVKNTHTHRRTVLRSVAFDYVREGFSYLEMYL